jgi:hypothetical protein
MWRAGGKFIMSVATSGYRAAAETREVVRQATTKRLQQLAAFYKVFLNASKAQGLLCIHI